MTELPTVKRGTVSRGISRGHAIGIVAVLRLSSGVCLWAAHGLILQ